MIPGQLAEALADRYAIQRELGGGGSATVYLAEDLKHRRQVAVKVLRPEFAASLAAERFLREIATVARLQHPHILPLLDSGTAAGFLYFVMPYVEGETLRTRLRREGRLSVSDVIRILADVTDAVAHAHARGVVHRDLKPENILLSGRHAVVTDFGVARAASMAADSERQLTVGVALGTPAYMSPEQAVASPEVDHRADLYALGVLAYELLAGRPPFTGATPQDVLTMHVAVRPEPVTSHRDDVPIDLAQVVMRCLEKRPGDRWQSAEELLHRIEPLATPSGGVTPAGTEPVRFRPRAALVAVSILGGAALVGVLLRGNGQPNMMARPEQVTYFGNMIDAALSPDGQFLAYVLQDSLVQRLLVRDTRSGGAIELGQENRIHQLAWSGDGSEIRYVAGLGSERRGYTVPRLGGQRRASSDVTGGQSPNGRLVARVDRENGTLEIRGAGAADSSSTPIPWDFTFALPVQWSADSRRLAVPLLGPTGSQRSAVAVARPGQPVTILGDEDRMVYGVAWGPAGQDLFVLRYDAPTFTVFRYDLDGGDRPRGRPVEVASGLSPYWPEALMGARLAVVPEGDRLLYIREERRSNVGLLAVGADPVAAFRELTTGTAEHPYARLSPDGRRVAFTRTRGRQVGLLVRNVDGTGEEHLADFEVAFALSWSPDGSGVVVSAAEAGQPLSYHVFRLGGGERLRFLTGAAGPDVHWFNPDSILYQRNGNQRLGVLDLRSGRDRLLPQTEAPGYVYYGRARPAGDLVAYRRAWPGQPSGVWLAGLGDSSSRPLAPGTAIPIAWSPDGRRLWAVENTAVEAHGALVEISWPEGATRVLDTVPMGFLLQDLTRDGRTMLLTRLERQTDLWSVALPPGGRAATVRR